MKKEELQAYADVDMLNTALVRLFSIRPTQEALELIERCIEELPFPPLDREDEGMHEVLCKVKIHIQKIMDQYADPVLILY
jgi:hypothetical protein